jgi:peptidyl-tRNA hydrolase, PTH1 family
VLRFRRPSPQPQALIFGLCNPGQRYARTRHNAGAWALRELAAGRPVLGRSSAHKSETVYVNLDSPGGEFCAALILPQTYMNLSGDCLRAWRRAFPKARIVVAYDDISLAPGKLRVREKGSAGGHNGVKSIIAALGGDEFQRLKIGVGAPPPDWDSAEYVLEEPSSVELKLIESALPLAARMLECLATGDAEAALRLLSQAGQRADEPDGQ